MFLFLFLFFSLTKRVKSNSYVAENISFVIKAQQKSVMIKVQDAVAGAAYLQFWTRNVLSFLHFADSTSTQFVGSYDTEAQYDYFDARLFVSQLLTHASVFRCLLVFWNQVNTVSNTVMSLFVSLVNYITHYLQWIAANAWIYNFIGGLPYVMLIVHDFQQTSVYQLTPGHSYKVRKFRLRVNLIQQIS